MAIMCHGQKSVDFLYKVCLFWDSFIIAVFACCIARKGGGYEKN